MNTRRASRREFIQHTGLAAAGIGGGMGTSADWREPIPRAASAASQAREPVLTMAAVGSVLQSYRIWDAHAHLNRFSGATTEEKVEDCRLTAWASSGCLCLPLPLLGQEMNRIIPPGRFTPDER
jgi:hypothetical protein